MRRTRESTAEQPINPGVEVDHGLSSAFIEIQPKVAAIVDEFIAFVGGAELTICNAPIDIGFLDH